MANANLPLDYMDDFPRPMRRYLKYYGWHFNKEAFEYAVSLMRKRDATGKEVPIQQQSKEQVNQVLAKYGIDLENDILYDAAFVFHMGMADYLGSSIPDEAHLARYVKDTVDDIDASPDTTFRRWVATMVGTGMPIDWSSFV